MAELHPSIIAGDCAYSEKIYHLKMLSLSKWSFLTVKANTFEAQNTPTFTNDSEWFSNKQLRSKRNNWRSVLGSKFKNFCT